MDEPLDELAEYAGGNSADEQLAGCLWRLAWSVVVGLVATYIAMWWGG